MGYGRDSYKVSCLTNPFPTLYIAHQLAPTSVPPDALSTLTNTDTSSIVPNQTCVVKAINNNKGEKIS